MLDPAARSETMRKFAVAAFEPDDLIEIRTLPAKRSWWVKAKDIGYRPEFEGQNVYAGANPRKAKGGKDAASVTLARSLFVDFDGITPTEAMNRIMSQGLPTPTIVVASGNTIGAHAYWRLTQAITDMGEWTARQKELIRVLNSDPAIHDPPRIMRLPGTDNVKRGAECVLLYAGEERYELQTIREACAVEQAGDDRSIANDIANIGRKPNPGGLEGLSRRTLMFLHAGAPEGERNHSLFAAACDYAGCGVPQAQAEADLLSAGARCGLTDQEILSCVRSAYGKSRTPSRTTVPERPVLAASPFAPQARQSDADEGAPAGGGKGEDKQDDGTNEESQPEARHSLSNVVDAWKETSSRGADGKAKAKVEHYTVYKPIDIITAELLAHTGQWPKLLGNVPFVMAGEGLDAYPNHLPRATSLFAWMHGQMDVRWSATACQDAATGAARTAPTKEELFEYIRLGSGGIEQYRAVTAYPHHPPIKGVYYAPVELPVATGQRLKEFLAMLNPETEQDRLLMLAALLTPGWGGEPGTRPMFVFTSDAGVGAGKTATAVALSDIWGGACQLDYDESWADLSKSMMSSDRWNARVLLFDNVKGKFGGSALESVVSSKSLSGWRSYVGQVSRPNDATIYVTFNMPQLTRDMADRAVIIKIGRPRHDKSFVAQSSAFISQHREQLVADLAEILKGPVVAKIDPQHGDRWQHWQREVLGRIPGGDTLAALVCGRRPEVDSDSDDAASVCDAIVKYMDRRASGVDTITAAEIHRACVVAGLWKDDLSMPKDKCCKTCVMWVRRILSGREVLSPSLISGTQKQARKNVYLDDAKEPIKSALYEINRMNAVAFAQDAEDDSDIPV